MQCNVRKAASFFSNQLFISSPRQSILRNLATATAQHAPIDEAPCMSSRDITGTRKRSSAALSRAACQAIRVSCNTGRLQDAFHILNSIRFSKAAAGKEPSPPEVGKFEPIHFDRPVDPRPASHALLHGLIRQGLSQKASQMATLMIQDGMKLRSVTLDALTTALCAEASASRGIRTLPSRLRQGTLPYVHPLVLSPEALRNGCLSDALRLMQKAEQYRQRRSSNMFERLIEACLLQGEILVGSLLFVLLVKDWERRRNVALRLASARSQEHELPEDLVAEHILMHSENLIPTPRLLNRIMRSIDSTLSQECIDSETIQPALQALANITNLLDDRRLPLTNISSLIRSLYRCPRVDDLIWIPDRNGGPPRQVNAYKYFHATLKRLISDLPTKPLNTIRFDPKSSIHPKLHELAEYKTMLPALDLPSYNSLLHYTLRHRLNPAMADRVLRHMTEQRHKPLSPDISTYNVILRSGTLLRKNSLAERVLEMLRRQKGNTDHGIMVNAECSTYIAKVASRRPALKTIRSSQDELTLPSMSSLTSLLANDRTLCAYILHLVATGRPEAVTQILFHVLPGLAAIDHPARAPSEANTTRAVPQKPHDGAALGPHFFTCILHALRKDGRTGLAERVWLYAKKAERASWDTAKPWCLPTAAYTIMIQCYGDEAKRSASRRHIRSAAESAAQGESSIPRRTDKVLGWARFARRARVQYEGDRAAMGLHMGLFLFRSMKDAAADVYKQLMKLPSSPDVLQLQMEHPQPDARFFNAALRLCTIRRSGRMRARSPTHYRRRHRFATYWLARLGHKHPQWTPALQEVCEAMFSAGYSVPIGLRYILIGRWPEENGSVESGQQSVDRQPYAFPRQRRRWHPLRLHTTKTRGLPLGRKVVQIAR
ncbi:hypothetical protein CCMSSC00406_0005358 [Pleurotus cornucopiae]|uniref:Uncharacterized protein n=1 Tax=Pleurotus cornucopiae TaxID=5321 RepID=A0ACB7IMS9_PLECO|nr:hypothetical protein CCMSSC00406_0005358 [Pleurotus cornucopiae]